MFTKCIGGGQEGGQVEKGMVGIYEIRCSPYQILSLRAGRLGSQAKLYSSRMLLTLKRMLRQILRWIANTFYRELKIDQDHKTRSKPAYENNIPTSKETRVKVELVSTDDIWNVLRIKEI